MPDMTKDHARAAAEEINRCPWPSDAEAFVGPIQEAIAAACKERDEPMVLLNHSAAHRLAERYPGRIGLFVSPVRLRPANGLPVALDNGRFSVWSTGAAWDEAAFWAMLDRYPNPSWVVVPDVVADAAGTFREWEAWAPRLRQRGLTLALAVQDGMTPESVRMHTDPDVIFVGGTKTWKRRTLWNWCREFPRVHCGRVNYERWLWDAHRSGAESSDGTGWFRGDQVQLSGLFRYLHRSSDGLGPQQLEMEFASTFSPEAYARIAELEAQLAAAGKGGGE